MKANEKEGVQISVEDNGVGIPKEHQGKILNKFYRVPESDNQHNVKGFGLGLFIVKESLKKIKGKLRIESEQGKGSKITIAFNV